MLMNLSVSNNASSNKGYCLDMSANLAILVWKKKPLTTLVKLIISFQKILAEKSLLYPQLFSFKIYLTLDEELSRHCIIIKVTECSELIEFKFISN